MKYFSVFTLILVVFLVNDIAVFADEKENEEEVSKFYNGPIEVTEDGVRELTVKEYESMFEETPIPSEYLNTNDSDINIELNLFDPWYEFRETSATTFLKPRVRVSNDLDCPTWAAGPCPLTVIQSITSSESFSIGLTATLKRLVGSGAGFTWHKSSTSSTSSSYSWPIPKGTTAYATFAPRFNKTFGYLEYYAFPKRLLESQYMTAESPRKFDGTTEGVFAPVRR